MWGNDGRANVVNISTSFCYNSKEEEVEIWRVFITGSNQCHKFGLHDRSLKLFYVSAYDLTEKGGFFTLLFLWGKQQTWKATL